MVGASGTNIATAYQWNLKSFHDVALYQNYKNNNTVNNNASVLETGQSL